MYSCGLRQGSLVKSRALRAAGGQGRLVTFGKGGGCGRKPSSSSNLSIRAFRAQAYQFVCFELILSLKLHRQLPVEQFEASRAIRADRTSVSSTLSPSYPCGKR